MLCFNIYIYLFNINSRCIIEYAFTDTYFFVLNIFFLLLYAKKKKQMCARTHPLTLANIKSPIAIVKTSAICEYLVQLFAFC